MKTHLLERGIIIGMFIAGLLIISLVCPLSSSASDEGAEEQLLKEKWASFTNYLLKGDKGSALKYIFPSERAKYKRMFDALGNQVPFIVSTQVELRILEMREDSARCKLITNEEAYEVTFQKDPYGNWWIYEF